MCDRVLIRVGLSSSSQHADGVRETYSVSILARASSALRSKGKHRRSLVRTPQLELIRESAARCREQSNTLRLSHTNDALTKMKSLSVLALAALALAA